MPQAKETIGFFCQVNPLAPSAAVRLQGGVGRQPIFIFFGSVSSFFLTLSSYVTISL